MFEKTRRECTCGYCSFTRRSIFRDGQIYG